MRDSRVKRRSRHCSVALALIAALLGASALAQPLPAAPPRNVDDVLAVLDQFRPDPGAVEKTRAISAAAPPADDDRQELAVFYHRRARAHGLLGNLPREIADLEKALEYAAESAVSRAPEGLGQRRRLLQDLRSVEWRSGNFPRTIELCRTLIRLEGASGASAYCWLNIALASVQMGDMETARGAAVEIEGMLNTLRGRRDWNTWEANNRIPLEEVHAVLLSALGNHGEAERRYRAALQLSERDDAENEIRLRTLRDTIPRSTSLRQWAGAELNLAGSLRAQGRLAEAEYYSRSSLNRSLQAFGRFHIGTAGAIRALAMVVFEAGRFSDAEKLSRTALETYQATGIPRGSATLARARAVLGAVLLVQSRWQEAMRVFEARDRDLASSPELYARLEALDNDDWAIALLRTGEPQRALDMLERMVQTRRGRGIADSEYRTAQLRGFKALALAATGRGELALAEFRGVIPMLLEQDRQSAAAEQGAIARQQRLAWILEGYLGLLWELRDSPLLRDSGIDAAEESFRISDVARGSSVQRALAASAARATPADPALADLARREQDALQRLTTLSDLVNRLLSAPPAQQPPAVIAAMRNDIESLEQERARLKQELAKSFPEYSQLIEPQPVTPGDVTGVLTDEEALLSIYSTPDRTYVWALRRGRSVAFQALAMTDQQIAAEVRKLRRALDPGDAPVAAWPAFDVQAAYSLYSALLEPVRTTWQGAKTLLIAPHKALGQLPFGLLVTAPTGLKKVKGPAFTEFSKVPWLIRNVAVVQLPTVSTLVTLRRAQPPRGERTPFVGFGDPAFQLADTRPAAPATTRGMLRRNLSIAVVQAKEAGSSPVANSSRLAQLSRLPDTADEVLGIARALHAEQAGAVFLGADASEKNVKAGALRGRRIVMFATHGLVPGDLDGLTQPALALAAPEVTGDSGDDGLLTLDEILALKLDADWVVLSACNTAAADGSGSEAVSGLGRGFFYAGARSLLVSNWPVETVSARLITTGVLERQAREPALTRAEALRQTMVSLIDAAPAGAYSYAHPLFWAPFSLVGDGGR